MQKMFVNSMRNIFTTDSGAPLVLHELHLNSLNIFSNDTTTLHSIVLDTGMHIRMVTILTLG